MHRSPLPALSSNLRFTVHGHPTQPWYAVKAPDQRFVRIGRKEYLIAAGLDGQRTASAVVSVVRETDPAISITEQEVLTVASWLGRLGLLATPQADAAASSPKAQQLPVNPVYTKIPLIAGEHLERLGAWFAPLLCWPMLWLVIAVWTMAGVSVLSHWELFTRATSLLFVSDGWLWWGCAWLVLKTLHELGHAVAAVRCGSQIRSAGVSLIFLAPVPYVDLSDLWMVPNRWQRILCCAGGMLVEMTLAAVAALIAIVTDNQSLQYFCCALATLGTVSTLAFNASPLIRFDGYFILSDLLNYPNLYSDAQAAAKQWLLKCICPWQPTGKRLSPGLVIYGLACYQYRVVVIVSLAVGAVLALQGIGLALVLWGAYAVLLAPWFQRYRARPAGVVPPVAPSSAAAANSAMASAAMSLFSRRWKVMASGGIVASGCLLLMLVPSPVQPAIPGYVALRDPQLIRAEVDGFLEEIFVAGESAVVAGELIARLSNPELETELALKRNALAAATERMTLKRAQGHLAESQAAEAQRQALARQVVQLERRVRDLQVRSPREGTLMQNDLQSSLGLFLKAGAPLAMVARPLELEVVASLCQHEVVPLRQAVGSQLSAHISGGPAFACRLNKIEPRASDQLTEPLLAAVYGGPIAVRLQPTDGGQEELKLIQPRFDMHLQLTDQVARQVAPGQLVWLRAPGCSASLMDALGRWCQQQWRAVMQQAKPGQ